MARIALTKEEVMAAFEKLIGEGNTPSAENIHALLGKGSIGMINRYIKEIIDENNQALLSGRSNADAKPASMDLPFDAPAARDVGNQAPTETPKTSDAPPPALEVRKRPVEERRLEPELIEPPLDSLSEDSLVIKIRRLESMLLKEQARREASERVALDTQTYADNIKEQVSERISDIRQAMELVIEQLKQQLKEQKENYELDLKFYREQLGKANKKLTELLG